MLLGCLLVVAATAAPTHLVDQTPVRIVTIAPGVQLVDFGRVAFGNVRLRSTVAAEEVTVHFGEALQPSGRIDRNPPGTVRYGRASGIALSPGQAAVAAPPPDVRNTWQPGAKPFDAKAMGTSAPPPPAILTPAEWGVVLPFRWVEIEGWPGELRPEQIVRQAAFASTWDDSAAAFASSDEMLNRVWELCRYSIKATTFAGIYVDGDRERIPYEADAYLNQLSHYATDPDVQMARDTYDHLMQFPTWPTEWASHLVFMVHADWWQTGDRAWLAARYEALRSKLLLERVGPDGLVTSTPAQIAQGDLVDWPKGERDGFVFTPVNTVVNAFYLRALERMAELARVLGRDAEAADYTARVQRGRAAFQEKFYDERTGLYRDGVGTDHCSLHANALALAFDLVPPALTSQVAAGLAKRGMDCSVYLAQYFLEALFRHGATTRALELMLMPGDRSWRHMLDSGATITWEAWDLKYKPNQDWNHAWGAAPANLLPRFVLGVTAAAPGWSRARIAPQPGALTKVSGRVPTPRGPVEVIWTKGSTDRCEITLPRGMDARVLLPGSPASREVLREGRPVAAARQGDSWLVAEAVTGHAIFEVR